MKNITDLKTEATTLGLEFSGNISKVDLHQLIEDFYESQSAGDLVKEKVDDTDTQEESKPKKVSKALSKLNFIAKAKKAAMAQKVVTVSSNDKRDNDVVTTAYLSVENQHFAVGRLVPLDIPCELEVCLIDAAKTTFITLHKDEIIDGKRTGNKIPVSTRKYNISYEEV